jgi:hypothetical protein
MIVPVTFFFLTITNKKISTSILRERSGKRKSRIEHKKIIPRYRGGEKGVKSARGEWKSELSSRKIIFRNFVARAHSKSSRKFHFWRLIRIKFASFALQLVHFVAGDVIRRTWPDIVGLHAMHAGGLNGRAEIRQATEQVCQTAEGRQTRESI